MGNAAALPERIDADTARALVGSDRLFQSLLPRAPWAVQKFRRGETISRSEARLIWERETYEGAARASSDKVKEHLLPSKQRYDTSEFDGDAKRAVAALERRLFDALTELKGLRPLRREAAELPILRGKLRRATEDVENVSRTCEQLERRLAAAKCELDGYKRHEGQAVDALKRRSVKLERKLADALEERDIARREADELRKDADASRAELRELLSKTQQRQLDAVPEAETLATTGPSRRRSPSPQRSRSPSPEKADPSKTGPPRVERDASPARSASPAKSDASAKKRDASPAPAESPKGRDASPEREPEAKFAVGAAVEARYRGKKKFYPGKILKVLGDKKYEIEYSDGDVEKGVDEEMIRALETEDEPPAKRDASPEREASKFAAGDAVEARFGGKKKWYAGKILKVLDGARYEVEYDDGDVEKGVDEEMIRARAAAPAAGAFAVGAKVECRYKGKKRYYAGVVAAYEDGTYAIDYDDGEKESGVSEELIRAVEEAPAPAPAAPSGKYAVGTKVEARYRGKKKWYAGEVTKINGDTYSITYEDGDVEDGVAEELIRVVEEAAPAPAPAAAADEADGKYAVGAKVECRYKGKKRYYPGRVASYSGGEYSIDYDDGEKESGVAEELIRVVEEAPAPAPAAASGKYAVGAKVEARYRGKKKWYAGEITKADGATYSVTYEDGDVEDNLAEELIRGVEEAAPAPAPASAAEEATSGGFEAGTQVLARYKGKKKWYPGTVMKRNDDNTYEIMYDDGDKESGVSADFVKAVEEADKGAKTQRRQVAAPAPAPAAETKVFGKGDKIEALYKGKKNWYAGVVDRYDAESETYDVTYDDGEVEKGVKQENIARAPGDSELEVGARIEAKYKGKKKYYPGKIAARGDNGTYDIAYDDGEEESGVARNLIREA
jgi:hypothetical protein